MTEQTPDEFDAEYDVVVIGSGASGKSAALEAARGGLSVAILEKAPVTGGTSVHVEGTAAYESSEQRTPPATGRPYPTKEDGYRFYVSYSHYRANPDVVRMFVDNSAETIDFYKELGVEYTDVLEMSAGLPSELRTFHRPEGLGEHCQEVLLKAVEDADVDIFTSTPAQRLVTRDGAVVGVVAKDADGNTLTVGAKAVVIATGGFANNPDLMARTSFLGEDARGLYELVPGPNTGDGIALAQHAGADDEGVGVLQVAVMTRGKTRGSHSGTAGFQPVLWVNKNGERFTNEEVSWGFGDAGLVIAKQPGADAFAILDGDLIRHFTQDGSDIGTGEFTGDFPFLTRMGQKLTRLQDELDVDVENGVGWRGDTLEELAAAIGADPAVLVRTVGEYNAACDAGYDPLFFKDARYLRPVHAGPFYAVNIAAAILVTCGGIRVNGNLQVTDAAYRPIPGLYAVGNDASGLYGDTYCLDAPGTTNGFAHTSGRVAGRHIVATLNHHVIA